MHKNISHVQSVLISKKLFPTEHEAVQETERLGYNSHFKLHPDSTQKNYWRFRQHVPFDNPQYKSKKLGHGNQIIIDHQKHQYDHERNQPVQNYPGKNGGGIHHQTNQTKLGAKHLGAHIPENVHIPHIIELNGVKVDLNRKRA